MRYSLPVQALTLDRTYCEKKTAMMVLARLLDIEENTVDSFLPAIFTGTFAHYVLQETLLNTIEQIVAIYQNTLDLDTALKRVLTTNAAYFLNTFRSGSNLIAQSLFDSCMHALITNMDNFRTLCKRVLIPTEAGFYNSVIDGEFALNHELGGFELQGYVDLLYQMDANTLVFVEIKSGKNNPNNSKQVKCYQEMAEVNNWFPKLKIISEVWYPFEDPSQLITNTRKGQNSILGDIETFLRKCIAAENLDIFSTPYSPKICESCNICKSPFHRKLLVQLAQKQHHDEWNALIDSLMPKEVEMIE